MPHLAALTILCLLLCTSCTTTAPAPQACPVAQEPVLVSTPPELPVKEVVAAKLYNDVLERDVDFTSEKTSMRATLTLPKTTTTAQQLPGIILLQDWGKSSRRGTAKGSLGLKLPVEVHVYETLARALARRGFAVLRFDKRNCVEGTAPSCTYPRDALEPHLNALGDVLLTDAEQALEALRQQPEVSPARVAVIGHGQGAQLALAMTSSTHPPAALVLLSASMSPIHEVIAHQTAYSLQATTEQLTRQADDPVADLLRQQIDMLKKEQQTQDAAFKAIRTPSASDPASAFGLSLKTWRSFDGLHQRAMKALVSPERAPLLSFVGALDADLPEDNAQRLTETLGGLTGTRQEILADTTHNMILIEDDAEQAPGLHPTLDAQIGEFLRLTMTRP